MSRCSCEGVRDFRLTSEGGEGRLRCAKCGGKVSRVGTVEALGRIVREETGFGVGDRVSIHLDGHDSP